MLRSAPSRLCSFNPSSNSMAAQPHCGLVVSTNLVLIDRRVQYWKALTKLLAPGGILVIFLELGSIFKSSFGQG